MVGCGAGQRAQVIARFHPWLPIAAAIGQAKQPAAGIEPRLLQRLLNAIAGHAARLGITAIALAFGNHQAGPGPWLVRAAPFDPGQAASIRTQGRCGVKIRTFGQ
ncbi:hypothetical protein D3C87_1774880 [compost metagenome]